MSLHLITQVYEYGTICCGLLFPGCSFDKELLAGYHHPRHVPSSMPSHSSQIGCASFGWRTHLDKFKKKIHPFSTFTISSLNHFHTHAHNRRNEFLSSAVSTLFKANSSLLNETHMPLTLVERRMM